MSKIVIAGSASCPYFAKCELLADSLQRNLPSFQVHKIPVRQEDWDAWLEKTCEQHGWTHTSSPIVWRELVDRGGKGSLIGDSNAFQEYANRYYGQTSSMMSDEMNKISLENKHTLELLEQQAKLARKQQKSIRICITNATGIASYNLAFLISNSNIFDYPIELVLFEYLEADPVTDSPGGVNGDTPPAPPTASAPDTAQDLGHQRKQLLKRMNGVAMELQDCACAHLALVRVTDDMTAAVKDCSLVLIMDNMEGEGAESFQAINSRFSKYASALNQAALSTCKVIVSGKGALNLKISYLADNTPRLLKQNIVGASQVLENQAKGVIAGKIKVKCSGVLDVTIWGDCSDTATLHLDTSVSRLREFAGAVWLDRPWWTVETDRNVVDDKWAKEQYPRLVAQRINEIVDHYKTTYEPGICISSTIFTMVDYWWNGSPENQTFSLTTVSQGWYNIPEGTVFSFPVTYTSKGYWSVREDIELSAEVMTKFNYIVKELESQKQLSIIPDQEINDKDVESPGSEVQSQARDPHTSTIAEDALANSSEMLTSDPTSVQGSREDGHHQAMESSLAGGQPLHSSELDTNNDAEESSMALPSELASEVANDLANRLEQNEMAHDETNGLRSKLAS